MKLSDYVAALQHIMQVHGDLLVLERRQVWYDASELFPNAIQVDDHVRRVHRYQYAGSGDQHHWSDVRVTVAELNKDRVRDVVELKAFVIENGSVQR